MPVTEAWRRVLRDVIAPDRLAGAIETLLLLAIIVAAAWVAARITHLLVSRASAGPSRPGIRTLTPVVESAIRYVIGLTALVLMLETLHVNVTAILASAGVIGLALGFGAQYLIRDVLAGFFLLAEGILQVGDLVRIDGEVGTVERVTLRTTQIRKFSGELLTVPNGSIARIGNLSRDFGRAVVQVTVPYRADLTEAIDALREAGQEWAASNPPDAQGEPVVDGTVDLRDTGVVLQLSVRVQPGRQAAVEADLRHRVLAALARRGIKIDTRISATI